MILCRTPLRISYFGGGTDIPNFWNSDMGRVLNSAINKYIYVSVKPRLDNCILVDYGNIELVDHVSKIHHDIIRECLYITGVKNIEIKIWSDSHNEGGGLGSSSSLTVGLLHSLFAFQHKECTPELLAELACEVEINNLHKPIGKQDQYIAAFGGLRIFDFMQTGEVRVSTPFVKQRNVIWLEENTLLFSTGIKRKADSILKDQNRNFSVNKTQLVRMRDQVSEALTHIDSCSIQPLGLLLQENWTLKKSLSEKISDTYIDQLAESCLNAGATGVKVTGAGGGGHLLVLSPPENHSKIREQLVELQEVTFKFDHIGTCIISNEKGGLT